MAGKKTRTQLQMLFKSGAKPSEQDFKDLIDSALNSQDDGIEKPSGVDVPLKILAHGTEENVLDVYAGDTPTWRLNQRPQGSNPGLNIATGGISKLFIESSSGNVGISMANPTAKLHIQQSGSQDALRIEDAVNDTTPFVIDTDGKVGIGIALPDRKLHIEQGELKLRASHDNPTPDLGTFYSSNLTQGIGIGWDRIDAIGSNANQDIQLTPKGTGKLTLAGPTVVSKTLIVGQTTTTGYKNVTATTSDLIVNGQFAAAGAGALFKLGVGYAPPSQGEGTLIVAGNLGIGTDNPLIHLAIGDTDTGFKQQGDGQLGIITNNVERVRIDSAGNVGIGQIAPTAKLEISGTSGNVLRAGAATGSTANIELAGHVQLREYSTQNIAFLQARDDSSNRNIGLRMRTQKAGQTAPSLIEAVTLSPDGNMAIGSTNPGTSKLKVALSETDFADIKFSGTGMGQLEMVGWASGWNINTKLDGKHLYLNRDAGSTSNVLIGRNTKELFVRGSDGFVGITKTDPRTALDTGTGVMSGAANDYVKAQFTLSGGGKVTWGGPGGRLKWTKRFIAISMERSISFATGHLAIAQPTADIPAANVWDGAARSASEAEGVLLKGWEALYAVHTVGGKETDVTFQIVKYTNTFHAPSHWILVAVVNNDDDTIKLGTGITLSKNSSSTKGSPIPTGVIMMWSGTADTIPDGWALCDKTNGTPDLRDRFIVGAGSAYAPAATGGAATVTLTLNQIPSHNHANNNFKYLLQRRSDGANTIKEVDTSVGEPDLIRSDEIQAAGGGQPHENLPPYYALCYIMKL